LCSVEQISMTGAACLLAVMTGGSAMGQASDSPVVARDTLRIGLFEPEESWADCIQSGALLAQSEWNGRGEAGGVVVELVRLPKTAAWRDAGAQLARFIVERDLCAVIGPSESAAAHVAVQVATRLRVPIITFSSDSALTAAKAPWIFSAVPSDLEQARALLRQALPQPEAARALLVTPPGRKGRARLAALRKACAELGVRAEESYAGQDAVLLWLDAAEAKAYLQAAPRALASSCVLGSLRLQRRELLESAADGTTPLILPVLGDGSHELGAALGYDALQAIVRAAEQVGTSRDSIRAGLARLPIRARRSGLERFDANGSRVGRIAFSLIRSTMGSTPPPTSDVRGEHCETRNAPAAEALCAE